MRLSDLFHNCCTADYKTVGHDVNYAFVEDGDHLYIYFQGSSSTTDWIRNFLFRKRPYKDMEQPYFVHRGFLAAWKEVEDIIIEKILEPDDEGHGTYDYGYKWQHITVVGYSHGGALAGLCHECVWFWRKDLREEGLVGYGFEAPRFFAAYKVRDNLKERWEHFTVVRTNNDIVTHCPPCIFGYTHVGQILQVYGDTSLVDGWYPRCVKSHFPQVVYDALVRSENEKA